MKKTTADELRDEFYKGLADMEKKMEESRREFDRSMKQMAKEREERRLEFERSLKQSRDEFERSLKQSRDDFNRRFESHGDRLCAFATGILVPNLPAKLKRHKLNFEKISREIVIEDTKHGLCMEIDALLENGVCAMAVEVKSNLSVGDVDEHIERMGKLRKWADLHDDKRIYYGAVAGMRTQNNAKIYAQKHGFFVIEPSGENVKVSTPFAEPATW